MHIKRQIILHQFLIKFLHFRATIEINNVVKSGTLDTVNFAYISEYELVNYYLVVVIIFSP